MLKERVLVLMGGYSQEREVSLRSGAAVLKALENLGYEAAGLDLKESSIHAITDYNPDLVFIALHGKDGEDGTVQGLLEVMGIPYTGSGIAASAIGIDKILTKKILTYEGIPTADFTIIRNNNITSWESEVQSLLKNIGLPMVIKAPTQGSSIGTFIVREESAILPALKAAFEYDSEILTEKFIDGTEVTSTVIGNEVTEVLPLIEITSVNEFYDFDSKYTPGKCSHIIPARVAEELQKKIGELSERVYKAIGCRGYARIDFIIDHDGNPYVLEINTIPGMTEMSLVPDAARAVGISFDKLVEKILKLGLDIPVRPRE
ncbi:MAG: D-alanine--D-alanine ligase [Syntrophomonas sp.]|nr:D-alanine--D-alanine ligase [Syntrophomonas sp.]